MTKLKPGSMEKVVETKICKEKKTKKKLNRRQRLHKKKLKKQMKINRNENSNQIKSKQDLTPLGVNVDDNKIKENIYVTSKPIIDIKNPENYSANWEKLKELLKEENKTNDMKQQDNFKIKKEKKSRKRDNEKQSANKKTKVESEEIKKAIPEIWFDDVDPALIQNTNSSKNNQAVKFANLSSLITNHNLNLSTKIVALDCEMVGGGLSGEEDILARVSLVDHNGHVLYDKYVKPKDKVKDYRTAVSGIRPQDIRDGEDFETVQKEVNNLIKDSTLVGHGLTNDFRCLLLSPAHFMIRDTSKFRPFIKLFNGRTPSLKKLSEKILNFKIQDGEHNSVQDAQAAMQIYMLHRKEFEDKYRKKLMRRNNYFRKVNKQKIKNK